MLRCSGVPFEVHPARGVEHVPLRCADVAIIQLHPRHDACGVGRTLRASTECRVLIALVSFKMTADHGIFDHVVLIPVLPADLVTLICSLAPC
jgi:hypothetical protein